MKVLKGYTYTWWQIGIFKLALLAIGIAIGAHWHDFFLTHITTVLIVAVLASVYVISVSLRQ